MAKRCDICEKDSRSGFHVSHSNRKTKREWKPNIQKVRAVMNGSVKRINVCTSCIRSGKVTRAI
ncbi:50S ribosomal protein L28 [Desulfuribacillus alkaliarsenatis]|uniref:Large ribosomal subunit protein bL28 n=1 Tax=Desulfuribacillus alkaliarsenatis TaxID=766136 RepID=A0A1E5G5T5_9FIRM|nr:50S ribosomal protein L28 [Desulfuribacillus alkaliarsenatis]OEF98542.1 50S ribosomal protein L28 [Desulfuribacillus alkaliarsenatis]